MGRDSRGPGRRDRRRVATAGRRNLRRRQARHLEAAPTVGHPVQASFGLDRAPAPDALLEAAVEANVPRVKLRMSLR